MKRKKKSTKSRYCIRNWQQYDIALQQRGSLTFWIGEDALRDWTTQEKSGQRGACITYTDLAIKTMATVQAVFHLAQRQTEGFLNSVFCLMGVALKSPDTRPGRGDWDSLRLPLKRLKKARHVVVDSTGVKVYGEGEWKVRQHGWSKRRTWRKLHLCVDEDTQEIISACASTPNVSDGEMVPELLTDLPGTSRQVSGDGQYDQRKCYEAINRQKAQVAIPPRKGARAHLAARQHGSGTPRAG